jgi:EpsI family protein
MQNTTLCRWIVSVMVLGTLTVNHIVGRLDLAKPHLLPVETFPRQIGDWRAGPDTPLDPEVQKALSTARVVQRVYTNSVGESVELLLLSANDYKDFHDPTSCFPGQGWTLMDRHTMEINGQTVNRMIAARENKQQVEVVYWLPGNYIPQAHGLVLQKALAIRHLVTKEESQSLFVRLTAPVQDGQDRSILAFAKQCLPLLHALTNAKG